MTTVLSMKWVPGPGCTSEQLPADTQEFLKLLDGIASDLPCASSHAVDEVQCAKELFWWDREVIVARAPGRLDVLGGISDYSGSLVLQQPTSEASHAAVQLLAPPDTPSGPTCTIMSLNADSAHRLPRFQCPMASLFPGGSPLPYDKAQQLFKADAKTSWAAYVAGCLLVLAHERGLALHDKQVAILLCSEVPEGKGVSSSAAVEVSTMRAILGALRLEVPGREMALLCVKVENLVVGAPCGTMDQMACALGNAQELLALLCQPAELQPAVRIPDHIRFWGIDSGERHSVGGCSYGSVRTGAFMGLRIATQAALDRQQQQPHGAVMAAGREADAAPAKRVRAQAGSTRDGDLKCPAPLFGGHLANITPSAWAQWVEDALPMEMLGADFLHQYGSHYDTATRVDPALRYAVRQPTLHPVFESHRVSVFRQVLSAPRSSEQLTLLGELMRQSHESYSRCKLGSPGTDRLVHLVQHHMDSAKAKGQAPSLFGAKITGGGSGGTVCIVGESTLEAEAAVQEIIEAYAQERGLASLPQIFRGSSMGAMAFGLVRCSASQVVLG